MLQVIDDGLVPVDDVLTAVGLDGLTVLLRADWLRLVSFERGIGHVLWAETGDRAIERLMHDPEPKALVKMTPTGANALRAMDDPPPAIAAFYERTPEPTSDCEVEAVTRLALIPAGLVSAPGTDRSETP